MGHENRQVFKGIITPSFLAGLIAMLPACGSLSEVSPYGSTAGRSGAHAGVDFAAPMGTPVIAAADGVVIYMASEGPRQNCGNGVLLEHPSLKYFTVYCHLDRHEKALGFGDKVKRGDVIGYVGATGNARSPHVHWQVCTSACIWGNEDGDLWGTIDPATATSGCFDAQKAHPADKFTYPLRCRD